MRPIAARLAATVLVTAAAGLGIISGTSAPATAAACSGSSGVTVVVDHGSLGGGIDQVCSASGGGKVATSVFAGAGFSLTYVQQQPGFVCRIDGQPSSDPCVHTPPSNAYWGLWWSDGRSGSWSYASVAAGSLTVPDGGYVAFAWQSGAQSAPGVPATAHATAPTPTPTSAPSSTPTSGGGGGGGGGNGGNGHHPASSTPKPSTKPSSKPTPKPTTSPTVAPSFSSDTASADTDASTDPTPTATLPPTESASVPPTPTEGTTTAVPSSEATSASATAEPGDPGDGTGGSLPVWAVPVVLSLLAAVALAVVLVRRRNRPSP
jgi:hypothetical protein